MQVTETLTEDLKREFKVVVPADSLNQKVEERLSEVGSQVRLPGFRPGKVPMSLLKKRFGGHIMGEVLEQTAQEAVDRVVKDHELRPALQPKVEVSEGEPEGDLSLTIVVELLPDFGTPDFSDIVVERDVAEVSDEKVDKALERLASARRSSEPVTEDRPAASGDVVVIDFVGKKDGEPFPGGTAEDYPLELGSNTFIPGFEDELIGVRAGEEKVATITFPEDYSAENLAGQEVTFDVTVKELRQTAPMAIDDELAQAYGCDTLDDLRQAIRNQIAQEYQQASRERTKRRLLDRLAEKFTHPIPEGLVDVEFDTIWDQLMEAKGLGQLEDEDKAKSEDELRAEYRSIAERRVRLGLLLAKVGEINGISVTQDDMNQALIEQVRSYPEQQQAVLNYYRQNPQAIDELRPPIFENKVVDYILERAQVNERTVAPDDLIPPDPAETASAETTTAEPESAETESAETETAGS